MEAPVSLPLAEVYRRTGARIVQPKTVAALAESMKVIGLKSPIEVRRCQRVRDGRPSDAFEIIAGQHRFEAARSLGWEHIDAFVSEEAENKQRLWEIEENLLRNEGSASERAGWHAEREAILTGMGLATKHGRQREVAKSATSKSYADQAAESLGVSRRTVAQDLARGKSIDADVLADVAGSDMDKGVVLDELARTPRDQQAQRLQELRQDRTRVRLADDPLNDLEATEKQLAALMAAWNRAGAEARRKFLDRVDTPVFDRGAA